LKQIAPGVIYLPLCVANAYLVGERGGPWVIVDTGTWCHAGSIRAAAEATFGKNARPAAIVLTHAHFDHCGAAQKLAEHYDVPVYAHPFDHPYLTGKDKLPPGDPTVGGYFAFVYRFLGRSGTNLGASRVRPLPEDGSVPGMPGWEWCHTPGHTPGHVSLFRAADRVLLAGDAFVTVNLDSPLAVLNRLIRRREICRPPSPATYDWPQAARSVADLAALRPFSVGTGHGLPLCGSDVAGRLQVLADAFEAPEHGRYVAEPPKMDERGIAAPLPPPAPDPLGGVLLGVGIAALVGAGIYFAAGRRRDDADA